MKLFEDLKGGEEFRWAHPRLLGNVVGVRVVVEGSGTDYWCEKDNPFQVFRVTGCREVLPAGGCTFADLDAGDEFYWASAPDERAMKLFIYGRDGDFWQYKNAPATVYSAVRNRGAHEVYPHVE